MGSEELVENHQEFEDGIGAHQRYVEEGHQGFEEGAEGHQGSEDG